MESASIELDQFTEQNRANACRALKLLSDQKVQRLKKLTVKFTGQNPYFYSGKEFVDVLLKTFEEPRPEVEVVNTLEVVDIGGLLVAYDDRIINLLSANHPTLRKLDIQNQQLICQVSSSCMLQLVQRCRNLQELYVYKCSLSAEILMAFTEGSRAPLQHLSLISRREERFIHPIPSEVWQVVTNKLPKLTVTLKFEDTCLLEKVVDVLQYGIPVTELWLETYMLTHDEVLHSCTHYTRILEKLVLTTPLDKRSALFDRALVTLTTSCPKLRSLHVFTVLDDASIQQILDQHPHMKERTSYTMKSTAELHPWTPGADY